MTAQTPHPFPQTAAGQLALVLWLGWDPLSGAPDEYVAYAPALLEVVSAGDGPDPDRIVAALHDLRRELEVEAAPEADLRAAWMIEEWWRWFFDGDPKDLDRLTGEARGN